MKNVESGPSLEDEPKFETKIESGEEERESQTISRKDMERWHDLQGAQKFLHEIDSGLSNEQFGELRELHKRAAQEQNQLTGNYINVEAALYDPEAKMRISKFFDAWDSLSEHEQKDRLLRGITELKDMKQFRADEVNEQADEIIKGVSRAGEEHLADLEKEKIEQLKEKDLKKWDELRSKQGLSEKDRRKLAGYKDMAEKEINQTLGIAGGKGLVPFLISPELRERYLKLLEDREAIDKLRVLNERLGLEGIPAEEFPELAVKSPEAEYEPLTYSKLREMLDQNMDGLQSEVNQKVLDVRLRVVPNGVIDFTREHIEKMKEDSEDLEGSIQIVQKTKKLLHNYIGVSAEEPLRQGSLTAIRELLEDEETTEGVEEVSKSEDIEVGDALNPEDIERGKQALFAEIDDLERKVNRRVLDPSLRAVPVGFLGLAREMTEEIDPNDPKGPSRDRVNNIDSILNLVKEYISG